VGHAEGSPRSGVLVAGLQLHAVCGRRNLRLATERRIEIIGEAARRISPELKEANPEIPWRLIVDQRNVLIHAYDEIEIERIWALAQQDIPRLLEQLEKLMPPDEG
jgi:uncharacterized protein with HEPN domain